MDTEQITGLILAGGRGSRMGHVDKGLQNFRGAPMALPVMFAGLRVATVANISLVSGGAIVGVGGLGALFTRGLQLDFVEPIVIGIILSVLLAGLCDLMIVLLQRRLTPWTRVGGR